LAYRSKDEANGKDGMINAYGLYGYGEHDTFRPKTYLTISWTDGRSGIGYGT